MSRAYLFDCMVLVKILYDQPRVPEYHLALPPAKLRISENGELPDKMPAMERRTFKYSFTEDGIDVYLSNTYILRLLMQNTSATSQRFIRSDTNVYEIVESVIKSNVNWFRSLLYDRPISEGEINCAVEVMTKEITHQITL